MKRWSLEQEFKAIFNTYGRPLAALGKCLLNKGRFTWKKIIAGGIRTGYVHDMAANQM